VSAQPTDQLARRFEYVPTKVVARLRANASFIRCPACGADAERYLFHERRAGFVQCRTFDVVYVNPPAREVRDYRRQPRDRHDRRSLAALQGFRRHVPVKTEAGERDPPILLALQRRLIDHRLASPWSRRDDPVIAETNGQLKQYPQRSACGCDDRAGARPRARLARLPADARLVPDHRRPRRRGRRHWRLGPLEHRYDAAAARGRLAQGRGAKRSGFAPIGPVLRGEVGS
jgi:hypothetical protein